MRRLHASRLGAIALLLGGCAVGGSGLPARAPAADGAAPVVAALPATERTGADATLDPSEEAALAASLAPPAATVTPKARLAAADAGPMKQVWQTLNNCGPAAVVMALSTLGVDVDQETARLALRGPDVRRGMGPAGVDPWVGGLYGLRAVWRYGGTNDLMQTLVSNGFAPMVTQWLYDPSSSRISHWRTVAGYDDAKSVFYVNDSMRGAGVPLDYAWFDRVWQSFGYRYLVIYRPADEPLLRAILADDWYDRLMRQRYYERARLEAASRDDAASWLAFGEAAVQSGLFAEAVAAFEHGLALGSPEGVFTFRSSYPRALRAVGRTEDADLWQAKLGAPPAQAVR